MSQNTLEQTSSSETIGLLARMGFNVHFLQKLAHPESIQERTSSGTLLYRYRMNGHFSFDPMKDKKLQKFTDWLHGKRHLLTGNFSSPNAFWNYHFTQWKNENIPEEIEQMEIAFYDARSIEDIIHILERSTLPILAPNKKEIYPREVLIENLRKIETWHRKWIEYHEKVSSWSVMLELQERVKKLLSTGDTISHGIWGEKDSIRKKLELMQQQSKEILRHATRSHDIRSHVIRILSWYDSKKKVPYPVVFTEEEMNTVYKLYSIL